MQEVNLLRSRVKNLEEMLQQNHEESDRIKTRFLATVSHELRTPMNAILGFSNLLIDKNLPHEKREEYMEHINDNSNNLLSIVDSMIDASLLEVNELKIKKGYFNLHKQLQQLYHYFNINKHKMGKSHVAILLNKEVKSDDFMIYSDAYRLQQVLSNLLHNALKFTSKGVIEFGYNINNEERKLQFFVKDSGKGILYEKAQSIFDKFEKVEDNSGKNQSGVGLGLTLAKGLITLLGGNIRLKTNVLNGTTFNFTIDYLSQKELNTEKSFTKFQAILV